MNEIFPANYDPSWNCVSFVLFLAGTVESFILSTLSKRKSLETFFGIVELELASVTTQRLQAMLESLRCLRCFEYGILSEL